MKHDETTIRMSKKTKEILEQTGKAIGEFGDTYDDIIVKLINYYKKQRKVKNNGASR